MTIKAPHWVILVMGLCSIVIAWAMNEQASGHLVLPATLLTVLAVLKTVLAEVTPSIVDANNARAASDAVAKRGSL